MTGNADFERVFRVQQNTLESLIMHLPALWLFAIYVSDMWASVLGAVWIAGRVLYAQGYINEARKRGPGMMISFVATSVLLLGDLGVIAWSMFK